MSDQNAGGKSKYESPILVPLGEMAKGSGLCGTGSSALGGVYGSETCSTGTSPVDYCSPGTNATHLGASYCSAGITAADYCSAGTAASASSYCTAGNSGGPCVNGGSA
jgi:hypothetical protein